MLPFSPLTRRFLLICLLLAPLSPASAQEATFTSEIPVDVSSTSAADAREQALKSAERKGLEELVQRLAPTNDITPVQELKDEEVSALIRSMEVLNEQISGTRYRASLRIAYDALAVNELLENKVGAESVKAAPESSSVLVLPLFESGGELVLWGPNNPWRQAWNRVVLERSGGAVLVPYGDREDEALVNAAKAELATHASLVPLRDRYGVGTVLVAKAQLLTSPSLILNIVKKQITERQQDAVLLEYRADPQETVEALLHRAAHDLSGQIEQSRNEDLSGEFAEDMAQKKVLVMVPVTTLDTWLDVRHTLNKLQSVRTVDLLALSPQQVDLMVYYRGDLDVLTRDLAHSGLRVIPTGDYLIVSKE